MDPTPDRPTPIIRAIDVVSISIAPVSVLWIEGLIRVFGWLSVRWYKKVVA